MGWVGKLPASPHARTHLAAVLGGLPELPRRGDINEARQPMGSAARRRLESLVNYLEMFTKTGRAALAEGAVYDNEAA